MEIKWDCGEKQGHCNGEERKHRGVVEGGKEGGPRGAC